MSNPIWNSPEFVNYTKVQVKPIPTISPQDAIDILIAEFDYICLNCTMTTDFCEDCVTKEAFILATNCLEKEVQNVGDIHNPDLPDPDSNDLVE